MTILTADDVDVNKRYDWYIRWESPLGPTTVNLYNKTYAEAMKIAEQFGYEHPKWWQMIRKASTIFTIVK